RGSEPLAQSALAFDLPAQSGDMKANALERREAGPVQAVPDLVQGKAELPQRDHLLQAGDVAGRVEAMARLRVQRRLEQADRVVVMERADGQPGPLRQVPHFQRLEPHDDSSCRHPRKPRSRGNDTTSRYVRIKGCLAKKTKKSGRIAVGRSRGF